MATKEKAPTLFEVMRVLSAAQRQELGALRRKWNAKAGVKEKLEQDDGEWGVRFYKGKKKLAEAKISPQKLEFHEL